MIFFDYLEKVYIHDFFERFTPRLSSYNVYVNGLFLLKSFSFYPFFSESVDFKKINAVLNPPSGDTLQTSDGFDDVAVIVGCVAGVFVLLLLVVVVLVVIARKKRREQENQK